MASVLTTDDHTEWGAPPPDQVIAHTNLYWTYQAAPGRTAGTVATKDVDFGGVSWRLCFRFCNQDAEGFVRIFGLGIETWASKQGPAD
jgi:hypothetical protein